MFQSGECVVYGIHGVCRIVGKEKQLVNRKRTEYLVLEPLSQNESRFYVPSENPTALAKLKPILSEQEMQTMLSSEEIREDCWIKEENLRKQHYRDLINGADRKSVMKMVCSLYRYKKEQSAAGRKFHQCDENFLRDAEKLLASEIALVLQMTQEQARDYLRTQLQA